MRTSTSLLVAVVMVPIIGCDSSRETSPREAPQAEAASPTEATIAPVRKKRAGQDDRYATRAPDKEAIAGEASEVVFRIEPRGDLKINTEYPWSITFDAPEGVELAGATVKKDAMKLADESAEIPVTLTPSADGEYKVAATGNFSVCNPQRCDILRDEPLEFTMVAVPATAPDETDEPAAPEAQ